MSGRCGGGGAGGVVAVQEEEDTQDRIGWDAGERGGNVKDEERTRAKNKCEMTEITSFWRTAECGLRD